MADKLDYQNRRLLLLRLLDYRNATKQNLVQWTGLSNTTVSDTINAMLKTGFVHTDGMQKSIGGRRSVIYSINGRYGQFAGIELYAQGVRMALCDAEGHIEKTFHVQRLPQELPIALLYRAIDMLLEQPEASNVLALGIGIEGEIDHSTQTVLKSDTLGWQNVPLKEIVERRIYLPVFIDSAVNGQVSLRKYTEGERCPAHFMVINGQFPSKAALCIDGHLCRGQGSRCGSAAGFSALAGQAAHALHTLGLEKVWVACRCEAQMKEAERLLCPCSRADICIHLAGPEELAWGMALDAETKWFGTIYFCAQNPISPPL